MTPNELVGKKYEFEDGNSIEVTQVKRRDEEQGGDAVTYNIVTGPGIPKRQVMSYDEFISTFGHLFGPQA
jgi:hypothetical protein